MCFPVADSGGSNKEAKKLAKELKTGMEHAKTDMALDEEDEEGYSYSSGCMFVSSIFRALCRIKLLPVTHVLVDTWMLTVNPVYKLSNVPDDLKWAKNTHVTPFTLTFKA